MNNYIFDLDGTLIDSSKEVISCMNKAFLMANYPIERNKLNSDIIGPPLKQIVINIAPELETSAKADEIIQNFRQIYDNDVDDISEVYDGVYNILDKLKKRNCKLFMATFKPMKPTLRIIKQFKLDYFEDIYTIDKFDKPMTKTNMILDIIDKYNLIKDSTVMVGDAVSDIDAANEAGISSIGACWGYCKDKQTLKEKATVVYNSIGELC